MVLFLYWTEALCKCECVRLKWQNVGGSHSTVLINSSDTCLCREQESCESDWAEISFIVGDYDESPVLRRLLSAGRLMLHFQTQSTQKQDDTMYVYITAHNYTCRFIYTLYLLPNGRSWSRIWVRKFCIKSYEIRLVTRGDRSHDTVFTVGHQN